MSAAIAKALLLRDALRIASQAKVSAQAQALLAVLIAEAWPAGSAWSAKLGFPVLTQRLGCSRDSLRRWAAELEQAELLRRQPGKQHRLSNWTIPIRRAHHCALEGAPMHPQGRTHATLKGAPMRPVSEAVKTSAAERASEPDGSPAPPENNDKPFDRIADLKLRAARGEPFALAYFARRATPTPTTHVNTDATLSHVSLP